MTSSVSKEINNITESKTASWQFTINVLSNICVMMLNVFIGLWFTPYLIGQLGVGLYGVVVLANSVTSYMSVVNTAIASVTGRYLTIDIQQQKIETANRTFNTAFWMAILLTTGILPVLFLFTNYVPLLFQIPVGFETAAKWLFFTTLISYLLVVLRGVFAASAFAQNRLDLQNLILSSNNLVRMLVVIVLFTIAAQPKLWHVGVGIFLGSVLAFVLSAIMWHKLTPELTISPRLFDRTRLRRLSSMSVWVVINQIGTLLFLNIDLIVVNVALGAEASGRYGSVLQWTILLRTLTSTVATALTPIVLRQYARGDMDRMAELAQQSVKLLGFVVALPVGLIVAFAGPLLSLWLGSDFVDMAFVLRVLVAHLCVNLAVFPLFSLQVAMNKVRGPGIVTLGMGILNIILAIWWVKWGEQGVGVALAGSIVLTLKNTGFIPIYSAYVQKLAWYTYLLKMIPGVVATLAIGSVAYGMAQMVSLRSWIAVLEYSVLIALIYIPLVYFLGLSAADRTFFSALIRSKRGA